jgi:hypothetical protein
MNMKKAVYNSDYECFRIFFFLKKKYRNFCVFILLSMRSLCSFIELKTRFFSSFIHASLERLLVSVPHWWPSCFYLEKKKMRQFSFFIVDFLNS